jgi:predicted TIM-barrel fold metal-dependent hydrolase
VNDISGIIDCHCHIAAEMCFPPSFREGVVANMTLALATRGTPMSKAQVARFHDSTLQDPLCDKLVAEMDRAGIATAVLLVPDFTYALQDGSHTIAELVEHHRMVCQRHPGRFWVMVGVDPRWGQDGLTLFERAISEYHFDGLKLYPPCGYTLADKALWPYYEICAAHSLPVLAHIGATSPALDFALAQPLFVDEAARAFPQVDFILAHGSVHYPDECAMLCTNRPNIYLDVSGYEAAAPSRLGKLLGRGIAHKVLFGTDWPVFRLQGTQSDFIQQLENPDAVPASLSTPERQLFLRGNAERLLTKKRSRPEMLQTTTTA